MSTRIFMLGFVFSKMLNPFSYTVFLIYFVMIYGAVLDIVPTNNLSMLTNIVTDTFTPLLFFRLLLFTVSLYLFTQFILRIIMFGKIIVRRSMFSFILALCFCHTCVYFSMYRLPITITVQDKQHALYQLFSTTPIETVTTVVLGILLALYIGVLSPEKFKKDIGFIDDTLS